MHRLNWVLKISLGYFFNIIEVLILIRIVLSWVGRGYRSPFSLFIINITEPILAPFRNLLARSPFGGGMIDLSPILAMMFIRAVLHPLFYYIVDLAVGF